MGSNAVEFWDRKILGWEKKRYQPRQGWRARWANQSLVARLRFAARNLNTWAQGKTILDLGCGSGRLFEQLDARQFPALIGMDFSTQAIIQARERFHDTRIRFIEADISATPWPAADFVVSLGFIDWLNADQLEEIFTRLERRPFLFSFSDRDRGWLCRCHRLYVQITYGWKNPDYIPRYYSFRELADLARRHGYDVCQKHESPELGLVSFISSPGRDPQ